MRFDTGSLLCLNEDLYIVWDWDTIEDMRLVIWYMDLLRLNDQSIVYGHVTLMVNLRWNGLFWMEVV